MTPCCQLRLDAATVLSFQQRVLHILKAVQQAMMLNKSIFKQKILHFLRYQYIYITMPNIYFVIVHLIGNKFSNVTTITWL